MPVTYYHLVFTLPHALDPWVQLHPRTIYALLFETVWATLSAFGADPKRLAFVYARARNRYCEGLSVLGKSVGAKVRRFIDEHVISLGIDPQIPPIALLDAEFADQVERQVSPRAKASEMEHAICHPIKKKHLQEDPVRYQRLSERLAAILKQFGQNWEQLALKAFVEEVSADRQADDTGLDPATQAPSFAVLKEEREKEAPVSPADLRWLAGLTIQLVDHLRHEVAIVGFWKNAHAQEILRGQLFAFLDAHEVVDFDRADAVADRLMALAKANHRRLAPP